MDYFDFRCNIFLPTVFHLRMDYGTISYFLLNRTFRLRTNGRTFLVSCRAVFESSGKKQCYTRKIIKELAISYKQDFVCKRNIWPLLKDDQLQITNRQTQTITDTWQCLYFGYIIFWHNNFCYIFKTIGKCLSSDLNNAKGDL